jgi:hypothetical protein
VFAGKRHLDDNALIRRYLADRGLEALESSDEALLRHLAHCPACDARYVALRSTFDDTREAAAGEAVAACSPERMERQRDRILRRIDALSGGTRVLPFPAPGRGARTGGQPWALGRWVAAAAVAGLVIGLTAGRLIYMGGPGTAPDTRTRSAAVTAALPAPSVPTIHAVGVPFPANEEQFLSEIELATAAPRAAELRAIYAFTLEEPRDTPRPGKD